MPRKNAREAELMETGEKILSSIGEIQLQLICARQGFETATDESLIDSYIFEIIALHKKYEFFLRAAKEMGLRVPYRMSS